MHISSPPLSIIIPSFSSGALVAWFFSVIVGADCIGETMSSGGSGSCCPCSFLWSWWLRLRPGFVVVTLTSSVSGEVCFGQVTRSKVWTSQLKFKVKCFKLAHVEVAVHCPASFVCRVCYRCSLTSHCDREGAKTTTTTTKRANATMDAGASITNSIKKKKSEGKNHHQQQRH